ncbi:MAG: glycosyltransferase family 2 protein [Bacteroidota bacterium]|nr:glycosyltransferase family 2 protein [Bacteroidota bacterium]
MISICVLPSDNKILKIEHLKQLLDSLCNQTYRRFEVVISDDSKSNEIKNFLDAADYKFDIHYLKNASDQKSASANINNAIRHAKYPIIKPIFQDDWIINDRMLAKIMGAKGKWGALGWKQSDKPKEHLPKWTNNILIGVNKIGCPTGIFFEKRDDMLFDENLVNLMDVDLYYRLYQAYGVPYYINEACFVSRVWDGSVSKTQVNAELHYNELHYLEEKYNRNDLVKKFDQRVKLLKIRKTLVDIKRAIFRS